MSKIIESKEVDTGVSTVESADRTISGIRTKVGKDQGPHIICMTPKTHTVSLWWPSALVLAGFPR